MSRASNRPIPPERIFVVDTSALIWIKKVVKLQDQWRVLVVMTRLVEEGWITFPRQVPSELTGVKYPDAPGAWVADCRHKTRYPQPGDEGLAEVLGVAPDLVEPDAPIDAADPYVLAMAVELMDRYEEVPVTVVSEDVVDRLPTKISILTACNRLEVEHVQLTEFLDWVMSMVIEDDL